MKKLAFLICCLLTSTDALFAQAQQVFQGALSATASIYNYSYRINLNPHVVHKKGHNNFALGPLFLVATSTGLNATSIPKLTGIKAAYCYAPALNSQRLEFYLGYYLLLQRIVDRWEANAFDAIQGGFKTFTYQNREIILENYLGYGFKLKFAKNFYLSKGVGIGVYVSNLKRKEISPSPPQIDHFDYRGYGDFGFSWNVQLGLGIRF